MAYSCSYALNSNVLMTLYVLHLNFKLSLLKGKLFWIEGNSTFLHCSAFQSSLTLIKSAIISTNVSLCVLES